MRTAEIKRKTKETDIEVFVKLDGEGKVSVNTGIGFFDHMLTVLGVHSGIDMDVECTGDLYVDGHHTVEDSFSHFFCKAFQCFMHNISHIHRFKLIFHTLGKLHSILKEMCKCTGCKTFQSGSTVR